MITNNKELISSIVEALPFDGCECACLDVHGVDIFCHCYKNCDEDCSWSGIHLTSETWNREELLQLGEAIRDVINRPDMNVRIVMNGEIIDAPEPEGGFDYFQGGDRWSKAAAD